MTASEIAMGRFMRAPDHPADEFAATFDSLAAPEDDKGAAAPTAGESGDGGVSESGDGAPAAQPDADGGVPAGDSGAAAPAGDGAAPADPPAAEKPGKAAAKGKAAAAPAGDPPAAAPADPPAAAADDGKPKAGAAEPLGQEDADAILARLAKVVKAAPADAPPAPAADEPEPIYTAEEQQLLEEHEKEWGDMARGEALKRRAEYRAVMNHVFGEVSKVLEPIREMVESMATRTHIADIKDKVGEYSPEEVDAVTSWAKEQPKYLQDAYMGVIEGGTASEVADLVSRYREATGTQPAGAPAAPAASRGEAELSETAKQAAQSLAPVDSKRSVVTQPEDQADFDGAWQRFATAEKI